MLLLELSINKLPFLRHHKIRLYDISLPVIVKENLMLAFARLAHLAVAVVTKRLQLIGKKTISRVKNDRKGKETCL